MDFKPFLRNKWLVLLGVLGLGLILLGTVWSKAGPSVATLGPAGGPSSATNDTSNSSSSQQADALLAMQNAYDKQLSAVISELSGVNSAVVMVTLDSTNQVDLANNVKKTTSSSSTTTDTEVFTQQQGGGSVPFVTDQRSPTVRGVVVLVDAKDFFVAKAEIIDAIGHVLDMPAYKISVEPKRSNP